jgi:choline dehydrogenase-like flavoprotein
MTHYWILGGIGFIKDKALKKFMGKKYIDLNDGPLHISYNDDLTKNNKLQVSCWLTVEEDKKFYKEIVKDILCVAPEYGKKIARMVFNKSLKCGNIFLHIEEKPIFKNSVNLSKEKKDPNNIPITKIMYKSSIDAKKSVREFLKKLGKLFQLNDLGRLAMFDELDELKQFKNMGNFHHMGGTRMGKNIKNSVVDINLKVHEIDNLYVSGSSIFRTSTYKNPTFQIIQFSLRLADRIKSLL